MMCCSRSIASPALTQWPDRPSRWLSSRKDVPPFLELAVILLPSAYNRVTPSVRCHFSPFGAGIPIPQALVLSPQSATRSHAPKHVGATSFSRKGP